MIIRRARPDEAAELTELALQSKAVWGYDETFIARCRAELTLLPSDVLVRRTHVADDGTILGFFTVCGAPPDGELDELYVAPAALRRGVGRALLDAALALARSEGFRTLKIHADPNAEEFYLRRGAVRVGEVASGSIAGRMLPLLQITP